MEKQKFKKFFGIFLAIIITSVGLMPQVRNILTLPSQKKLLVGDVIKLPAALPIGYQRYLSYEFIDHQNVLLSKNDSLGQASFKGKSPGQAEVNVKLFGTVPLKHMVVDVLPELKVIPSGESIGVLLRTQGVVVVGQAAVIGQDDQKYYPAKIAGIEIGDYILKINEHTVENDEQAANLINTSGAAGKPIELTVRHENTVSKTRVYPVFCKDSQTYRIGLYIRDNAAGIGTLTFYEPNTGKYGALGHLITDGGNNKLNLNGSKIVRTFVQSIKQGRRGDPGEKVGIFADDGKFRGNIEKNSQLGIYGTLNIPSDESKYAYPVALANEVQVGPAKILTVLKGNKVEPFNIEILRVMPDNRDLGKGMVIEITDKRLLDATGGIIQGMSGSPIIQNGKLVGAVTHVFVNDPTRGYGVMAEWMLQEAGLIKLNAFFPQKNLKKVA